MKYILLLFLTVFSFAAEDLQQFPSLSEQNITAPLVGDDQLPKTDINRGINYNSNVGTSSIKMVQDEYGNRKYIDENNSDNNISYFDEEIKSPEYLLAFQEYKDAVDSNASADIQASKLRTLKLLAKKESRDHGHTIARYESTFLKSINPAGSGSAFVNQRVLTKTATLTETESNVTDFYNASISPLQSTNTRDAMNNNDKAGGLIAAYKLVKDFEQQVRAKVESSVIRCYISRELVPAFYCPFPDMTNTMYPDFSNIAAAESALKVSANEAQGICNDVCQKQRSCIPYNVISDTALDFSADVGTVSLFPSFPDTNSTYVLNTSNSMEVKSISYKITITPSAEFTGSISDFETFLSSNNIKFRTTLLKINDNPVIPPQVLIDKEITELKSTELLKIYTIGQTSNKFGIKIYKPYIYESYMDKWKEADVLKNIGEITITEVKGEYASKDVYFCAYRQLVNNASDCKGTVIDIADGASVYHVCTSDDKKIGPNVSNGGFYTQESCTAACVEKKECLPTYRHYASTVITDVNSLFKAKVGCVDAEDNQGCTQSLCESFFADGETRPNNEIIIQNDNERVYTIQNKALTGVFRPKINYDQEINSATTDYNSTFQTEMKDAAYQSMITNQSYDRITNVIGVESSRKQAYVKDTVNGKTNLQVLLKPKSFDIDNGTSYKIYSVIKFEQSYQPKYGLFMVDGQLIDATNQNIMFKDVVYMIKDNGFWKVFKQINYAKVKKVNQLLICLTGSSTDETVTTTEAIYIGQAFDADKCKVQSSVVWNDIPSLTVDRNVFYEAASDTFLVYSLSEIAPHYVNMAFPANIDYQRLSITDWLERDLDETQGAMIRSQLSKNNGASFSRVYQGLFKGDERGWPANMWVYNFYSDTTLTYNDIFNNMIPENIIWELANPRSYPSSVKDDTQIQGNNIKAFTLGTPNNTTISLDINPKFAEENKRVFKFIFLYDPAIIDPFKNYEINGSTTTGP